MLGDIDQVDSFVKSHIDPFPDRLLRPLAKLSQVILAARRVGLAHNVFVKRD